MTIVSMNVPGTSLSKKVRAAIEEAYPIAEQSLRVSAVEAGWPVDAANDISISGTKITVGDQAANWEFGLPGKPPTPVARNSSATNKAVAAILDDAYARLKKAGVL